MGERGSVSLRRLASVSLAMVMLVAGKAPGEPQGLAEHAEEFGCAECDHGCAHAKRMMARFAAGLAPIDGAVRATAPENEFTDLQHYNLDIRIDPVATTIVGSNELTVRSVVDGLTTFDFRLQNNFTIGAVMVNGAPAAWTRLDSARVRVTLDQAYDTGHDFVVRVEYGGQPINNGFDSINFTTHSGVPVVSTLSETDFAYTWWPVKEDNRDKATADLRFTIPSAYSVASNGLLVSTMDVGGGWTEWYWKTEYQTATYLFSFSMTNYNRFSGSYEHANGVMPLEFFVYPENDTPTNRSAWLRTEEMLPVFSLVFGEYPFINEKYGIYQFPFGGGMEHQTMTGQGTFSESVTAHELAHQWWGDAVTCAFWNDIWLNEGFATYGEALWYENKAGSSGLAALHQAMAARRPSAFNGTCYKHEPLNTSDINTIFSTNYTYRKPAWVLHMLRRIVGDETFFDILAAYRGLYEGASATTEDFRAVAEAVSGMGLEWFFEQWVYDMGAPAWQRANRVFQVNGTWYVEMFLRQAQSASFPIFTMPLDVISVAGGAPVHHVIWTRNRTEHHMLRMPAEPTSVQLDPAPWVLASSNLPTTFQQGPPKALEMSPAPESTSAPEDVTQIRIWFSKNIATSAAHFTLTGATSGVVPCTFNYNGPSLVVTLTPQAPLAPDVYTLTMSQSIVDTASGQQLDGEYVPGAGAEGLPSGDGVPGGAMVVTFTIAPPGCQGDADGSGEVDFTDITAVIVHWGGSGPLGDADGNGEVNFEDITTVLTHWGAVCP